MEDNTLALKLAFDKSPEAIVKILKEKGIETSWDWVEQLDIIKRRCFTVAKCSSADILELIKDNLEAAMEKGVPFDKFRRTAQIQLAMGGFAKREDGKPWRLDTIFRMNMQSAFSEGRYQEQKAVADTFPYWEFVAIDDRSTTDGCRSLNGTILKQDDPFWSINYPPRHFHCRSRVRSISKYEAADKGFKASDSTKYTNIRPAKGFDTNPGEWTPNLGRYGKEMQNGLRKELRKALK